jgi:hypothetical protein
MNPLLISRMTLREKSTSGKRPARDTCSNRDVITGFQPPRLCSGKEDTAAIDGETVKSHDDPTFVDCLLEVILTP